MIDFILGGVLIALAVVISVLVMLQKSKDKQLSGTIAGGSETYYGKDKAVQKDKILGKWLLIVSVIFAVAVLVVYVMQPDYNSASYDLDQWQGLSEYSSIFN